jgi:hypothetical protein
MRGWEWLTKYRYTWGFALRVLVKAALLFALLNALAALVDLPAVLGRISIYNTLVAGRERLPYGERADAYNLSMNNLEAMFASHAISQPKAADEFRVVVIGDSSVWGILLDNDQTLPSQLAEHLRQPGESVRVYNIGYPRMSVTQDVLLLDYAMRYQPDLIVWMVTLESMSLPDQLEPMVVQVNAPAVRRLIADHDLPLNLDDPRLREPDFLQRTLVGQRRPIADWLRLQLYGIMWQATKIDQVSHDYPPLTNDFGDDLAWKHFADTRTWGEDDLAYAVIEAGHARAADVPVLLVNEPIYIADGVNSDLRYNFWYPRWAYDQYRALLAQVAERNGWHYLDLWDLIPPEEFTDSPVHLSPEGTRQLSERIAAEIRTQE